MSMSLPYFKSSVNLKTFTSASQPLNSLAICRDSIVYSESNKIIGSYLFGLADFIYNEKLNIYKSWID